MLIFLKTIRKLMLLLFWLILMLGFSDFKTAFLTVLAASIHELGHILSLILLNKSFSLPKLVSSGFRIKSNTPLSYKEEIWVCACGPLTNLITFTLFINSAPDFAIINLATALSNLLPIPEYDGYKIIMDLISVHKGIDACEKIMPHITVCISALAVFLSLFLIMNLNGGYWLFAVFFIVFTRRILFFQKDTKNEF